jgi:hypothetical protein
MENSKEEDRLFICRIRKTLQKYNLPSPEEIYDEISNNANLNSRTQCNIQ